MLRVLQSVNKMDRAGLETMLMNYYRNSDRDKIQFDFLTHRPSDGAYDEEIRSMGGKVYHAPRLYPQNYPAYFKYMKAFFAEHREYKIIHSHIDTMSAFPLYAAKRGGVPVRIAHSHSTSLPIDAKLPIKYAAKFVVPKVANQYYACGIDAGKFMYGKDSSFTVIHNAIDLNKFAYDENIRKKKRVELGIDNSSFVIGHVGRYNHVKNQTFLIEIFGYILKSRPDSVLLIIGKGEDEQKLRGKAGEMGVSRNVKFLIDRSDVAELYQAMDIFVMPSLFEGLPVVGVEAQTNGLPCYFSDKISDEVRLTRSANIISLNKDSEEWADLILSREYNRNREALTQIKLAGYDIKTEAEKLTKKYFDLLNCIQR